MSKKGQTVSCVSLLHNEIKDLVFLYQKTFNQIIDNFSTNASLLLSLLQFVNKILRKNVNDF